ncbi:MAG: ATP-dependent zinc metalloprotease FtsH [Planctomycetes bacterium]|nr:ATP-dependent zinc metalloprotease FtsH [Planctomycetota bacterium]
MMNSQYNKPKEVTWQQFMDHARNGEFVADPDKPVLIKDDSFVATLTEDAAKTYSENGQPVNRVMTKVSADNRAMRTLALEETGVQTQEEIGNSLWLMFLINWGPFIVIALLIYFFIFRAMRNAAGGPGGMLGNFGRSKHKMLTKEHSSVTLDDVAGIDEAKEEVTEIIEFLKNPKKFQRLGGRVPRGVLLVGQPGCGKTLLAKAMAGEADVPFFSISGSDFVEMFVGVGASRVRDLFKQAKDNAPCIIFLDEIDAVGRRRGAGFSSGGHDEREQTLNAILVEMDGFDSSDQVIVVASTNRADVLDPALVRPGRFDRQVQVPMPDIKGRMEILKVHSRKIKMSPTIDLEKLARGTPMFSGAELEAIINEAAIAATLQNKDFVEQEDIEEARDKVRYGRSRRSARVEEEEKNVIAYHEAGHAVVTYFEPEAEPLHKVTIIPRGPTLGATMMLPEKDRYIMSRKRLLAMMRVSYGGRIAEEKFTGDQYNGTAGDIRQATNIARAIVTEYGMSDAVGFQYRGDDQQRNPWEANDSMSNETAKLIDDEIKRVIDQTYGEAVAIIEEHADKVDALAQALLKYETLSYEEVEKLMKGEQLDKATVAELLQAEKDKAKAAAEAEASASPTPDAESDADYDTPGGAMPSPA